MSNYLNISIGSGLVPHWLNCFNDLHYYHLSLCRANAGWHALMKQRKTKWSRASWKGKFFSSSWGLDFFFFFFTFLFFVFCFCFFLRTPTLHVLLVMLFIHIGKSLSSSSQMLFKTGVLKNFAIFIRKQLCWGIFLIKLQDLRPAFSLKSDSKTWQKELHDRLI